MVHTQTLSKCVAIAAFAAFAVSPMFVAEASMGPYDWATAINPFEQVGSDLDEHDIQLQREAMRQVLNDHIIGGTSSWISTKTGRSGRASLLRLFQKGGHRCGAVEHIFTSGGSNQRYVLPLCEFEDGIWKIWF